MAYPIIADAARSAEDFIRSLDAETVLKWGEYFVEVVLALFVLRTLSVVVTRAIGLYHPNQYRWYPRIVPWRAVFKSWMAYKGWQDRTLRMGTMSSGGFCSAMAAMTLLYTPGKVFLGRAYAFGVGLLQPLGLNVRRHLMMIAMTGAGKTTLLITMIKCWIGSALIVDPKGQITRALALKDKTREWFIFDIYNITGLANATINVFDVIKWAMGKSGPSAAVLWSQRIAQCLINTPAGSKSPYFYDIARGFVAGLILYVLVSHPEKDHNLPFVRTLIVNGYRVFDRETGVEETKGDEAFRLLLRSMKQCSAYEGVIAGAAAAVENAAGETLGNILSTMQEQTKQLDIPDVRKALMTSSFSLAELKTCRNKVLSLVAPVSSIKEELKEIFRLAINMVVYIFETEQQKAGQCLFAIDELPSLGHNPTFEMVLPVARSYAITFLGITQDIDILKKAYPQTWETFIGNADCVYWMGTNHEGTLKYLSNVLGNRTIVEKDKQTQRKSHRQVAVAEPDQLRRFLNPDAGRMIITRAGARAIRAVIDAYFRALPVWAYDPDPDHKETWLRRFMRLILRQ